MEAPSYFTKEFLENSLKDNFAGSFKVKSFSTTKANATGDNYTSEILRTLVEYTVGTGDDLKKDKLNLIVKCMLQTDALNGLEPFIKESEMYSKILLKFQEITSEKFSAKCYHVTDNPNQTFVFEDLNASGYSLADRLKGLDFDHSKLVVEKLGKFHAVSMILAEKLPKPYDVFHYGFFHPDVQKNPNDNFLTVHFEDNLKVLIEILRNCSIREGIIKKLEDLKPKFLDEMFKCVNQASKIAPVLNHGDLWTNNIMFKYNDSSEPEDVAFIDFQDSFYTGMGIDWNYFIYTSPTIEVRKNHAYQLLEIYYQSFRETLEGQKFDKSKIPSFEEVCEEAKRYQFYGVTTAIGILPLVLMEKGSNIESNLDNLMDENVSENLRRAQMGGHVFQKTIVSILEEFDSKGLLEI